MASTENGVEVTSTGEGMEANDVEEPKHEEEDDNPNPENVDSTPDHENSTTSSPHRASRRVSEANLTAAAVRRMSHRISINSAQSGGGKMNRRMTHRMSVTATSAPFDVSYHPGIAKFFSAPHQRQRWGDNQILPRVNWGDLFFDLFYVAAAYNISNLLVDSPTRQGFLYFVVIMSAVMSIWWDKTYYDGRFVVGDDLYHRFFEVAHLCALASVVAHIGSVEVLSSPSKYADAFGLCASLAITKFLFFLRQVEVYYTGVGERQILENAFRREGSITLLATVLFTVAAIVAGLEFFGGSDSTHRRSLAEAAKDDYSSESKKSDPNDIPVFICLGAELVRWVAFAILFLLTPNDGSHKKSVVPMNIDFLIHRTAEWTMLMLGESILSLLIVDVPYEDGDYFATFYCGLLTVTLLQVLHFRSQPHLADQHATRRDKVAGIYWTFFQYIYSMSLVALGAAFTLFLIEFSFEEDGYDDHRRRLVNPLDGRVLAGGGAPKYDKEEREQRLAHLYSMSLSLIFLSLDIMSILHVGLKNGKNRCVCEHTKKKNTKGIFLVIFRGSLILFIATLSQWTTSPHVLAGIGLGVTLIQLGSRKLGAILFPTNQVHAFAGEFGETDVDDSAKT